DRKTCTSDPETAATDAAIAANCNRSLTPLKQMIYNPDMKTSLCQIYGESSARDCQCGLLRQDDYSVWFNGYTNR
ncbi:hypothetical protein, partial [Acidithiobacillus sp.]|uniref:hypothetical protein n=1 Tax=Acidithiobacillus sp. TaxID=1872118 RepID=UPI0025846684